MAEVFVVGAADIRPEAAGRTTADLAYLAARDAMEDAGVGESEVPAVFVGSGGTGAQPSVDAVAVRLGLRRLGYGRGLESIEHVSAFAGEALHRGWQAVEMGVYDVVLCVGAGAAAGAAESWPPEATLEWRAAAARRYMDASGATIEQLARVSAKNRRHGALNARGRAGPAIGLEDVLDSELLAWPLRRLMVACRGEGAAAVVLASRRTSRGTAIRVRASLLVGRGGEHERNGRASRLAYQASAVGPEELDVVELDDVTAAAELAAYEELQLAPEGEGPELIDSGFTALGGVLPVNTSGGLLSLGELPAASGIAQVCHVAWQLRGEAGALQVAGARVGLTQSATSNGGGLVALTILSA